MNRATFPRRRPAFTMLVIQARNGMGWGYCPKGSGLEQCCRYTDKPGYDTAADAVQALKRDNHIPANVRIEFDPDPDATVPVEGVLQLFDRNWHPVAS